jgi:hypothetical protein
LHPELQGAEGIAIGLASLTSEPKKMVSGHELAPFPLLLRTERDGFEAECVKCAAMAQTYFLFRFDGAEANTEFVARWQQRHGGEVYSGTSITVGLWTPDLLEVVVDEGGDSARMTLIELEQTEKRARESCRQYLPESSSAVRGSFGDYLETILDECRRRTDRRFDAFQNLKSVLNAQTNVIVRTAGALRTSADLLEVFPLRDQPDQSPVLPDAVDVQPEAAFVFDGERLLVRKDLDVLRRVVRILHAVATRDDHSGGVLDGFSRRNPLRRALEGQSDLYPELSKLVSPNDRTGARVNCGLVTNELAALLATTDQHPGTSDIRRWIEELHPAASRFSKQERMQVVFEQVRKVIAVQR